MDWRTKTELDAASTPRQIEERSFAIIDAEIPEPRPYSGALWSIARRCIHTTGDPSILKDLSLDERSMRSGLAALSLGCLIVTDTNMAREAMPLRRLNRLGARVTSIMDLPHVEGLARQAGTTKARAGIMAICGQLEGAIVVIGNAPTALLTLLECLDKGSPRPALIVGMPVGFVNAAQAKTLLATSPYPHFTLRGRRGGSAVAAACVNALAELALTSETKIA
ncbi:MAG: precorrin-8X methylmutase [Desulfovibrio sp.]|nr:precorrin-8X methylmutase [Desulfovibrio sp.]